MPDHLTRKSVAVFAALVAPPAVCAVLLPFRTGLPNTVAAMILVVAVVAVAALGHRAAGVFAALSAAVWFDFFFTAPYQRLTIHDPADLTTAIVLLVVALAVSQLAARARRLEVVTITDADYLAQLHHAARLVQTATSPDTVVECVRGQLVGLLHLRGCRFQYGVLLGHAPRLENDGSITVGRKTWDTDRLGLPDQDIELRVFAGGHFHGRYLLEPTPGHTPPLQARLFALTLADQAGAALQTTRTQPASRP
ncbi:DUF4118 domain-containing protein [Streptomyces sp. SID8381]|uniref:DUF4118 domain-containing protein n=1 Tax=unclassified Streptomyces TaxID=2593676 RepID=UPI00037F566D|nr:MULTISPECIES: DUF4118 domain-containing protein [unclassified Streptomyces]MYX27528.1 DUF4118 domain-containing protein [Streptomyces sp. SID8381]